MIVNENVKVLTMAQRCGSDKLQLIGIGHCVMSSALLRNAAGCCS
jgi:hypothetical protein